MDAAEIKNILTDKNVLGGAGAGLGIGIILGGLMGIGWKGTAVIMTITTIVGGFIMVSGADTGTSDTRNLYDDCMAQNKLLANGAPCPICGTFENGTVQDGMCKATPTGGKTIGRESKTPIFGLI